MLKRFLIAAALVTLVASAAYAAPPSGKGNANNPAKTCKKEGANLGSEPFNKKYGTNHNLRNAFGKCVSGKSKGKDEGEDEGKDDEQGTSNAAKQCKKEWADIGAAAFANKHGTNHNKANAFGKCVSSKSKKSGESDDD